MRRVTSIVGRCVLASACLLPACSLCADDDSWPRYAHDPALTGRTSLTGDIQTPREGWSLSLTGIQLDVELSGTTGTHRAQLPGDLAGPPESGRLSFARERMIDIDGTGQLAPVAETPSARWAKILHDIKGFQRVRWDRSGTTAKISRLQLVAFDQGRDHPRIVWQSEPEDTIYSPLIVVHDMDGDGVQEICVATHYRVLVYEGTTGRKETELRYHSSRNYGWFGRADVDADGRWELVMLADFQSHFEVLDYDPRQPEPDRLSVRWKRDIELQIERRASWPQIGPRPVVNVTGDRRPEIVVNLFNDNGDGQWHTQIIDAETGETWVDLPRRYTLGNADVDGDGRSEIFCVRSEHRFIPEFGTVEVVRIEDGAAVVLWNQEDSGFATVDLKQMEAAWASGASQGMRFALLTQEESRPAFLVASRDESVSLSAMRFDEYRRLRTLWQVEGWRERPEPIAVATTVADDSVAALIRVKLAANQDIQVVGRRARLNLVDQQPLDAGPLAPIAARPRPASRMNVYVEGPGETIFAVAPPNHDHDAPRIVWQRPGRGMGNQHSNGSIVAVDLDGDDSPELVSAGRTASGAAELVAWRANGELYWRHVCAATPGARPRANVAALTWWWPGRFRASGETDLFVNTSRGLMHSSVGHLLDGRTGRKIWSQEKATIPDAFSWAYGGVPIAVHDMTGNQRDELINLYPVCYWMADGKTGQLLAGQDLAAGTIVPAWAAYGEPTVWDFDGDGHRDVLLDSMYILALLDSSGNAVWHGKTRRSYPTGEPDDNVGETTRMRHALVDFDADGIMEIASAGYGDGVRAIDPRDGNVLWSLAAPNPTRMKSSAADIDGVDGDELIYVAGNTLVVVTGDRSSGKILWTWDGPSELSLPAIADVDDDGLAEIVLQSSGGIIHCIDGPAH